MKEKVTDPGTELEPIVVEEGFVEDQMNSIADAIMLHSLGNENFGSIVKDLELAKTHKKIAEGLSRIQITDPNLDLTNSFENPSRQAVFDGASIAKARIGKVEEIATPALKSRLDKFSDKIFDAAGKFIAEKGGKKAIAATSTMALLVTACSADVTPTPETPFSEPTPITESTQEDLEVVFSQQGPEATAEVVTSLYPQSLTVEEISESLNQGGGFPLGFPSAGVNETLDARNQWFEDLDMTGVVGQLISNGKEGEGFRWAIKPVDQNGNLAGWLQIKDENVEGGWRYAERPTWEPVGFDPASDEFRFTLPDKLNDENSFELIPYGDEFWILVEVDKNGQPVRHLDTVAQEMKGVVGAETIKLTEEAQALVEKRDLTQTTNPETGLRQLVAEDGKVWFVEQDNGEWEQRLFELTGTENRLVYASGSKKDSVVPLGVEVNSFSPNFDVASISAVVTQEPWLDAEGNWRFKIIVPPVGWQEEDGLPEIEMVIGGLPIQIGATKMKDFLLQTTYSPGPKVSPEDFAKMLHVGDQAIFTVDVHMRAQPGEIKWGVPWGDYLYQFIVDHSVESDSIIDALSRGEVPSTGSLWGTVNAIIGSVD